MTIFLSWNWRFSQGYGGREQFQTRVSVAEKFCDKAEDEDDLHLSERNEPKTKTEALDWANQSSNVNTIKLLSVI